MSRTQVANAYCQMTEKKQIAFMARLAQELTVLARDTYIAGTDEVADPPRLRTFNEMQHRVTGQLIHLIDKDSRRYPDRVMINILWDYAQELRCEQAIISFLKNRRNQGLPKRAVAAGYRSTRLRKTA